tara:strand:+ start:69 stop:860 length:792 start_codon:yes stop_codon:yes gene_type:complete
MADRIIKGDSGNDVVIQNNDASRKIEVTNSGDVEVTGDFKATTVKATNLKANDGTAGLVVADSTGEVTSSGGLKATNVKTTNLKANDGTAGLSIADSTGRVTANEKISTDDIIEKTTDHGVEIEGVLLKDSEMASGAIGSAVTMSANQSAVKTALNASGSAPIFAVRAWINFDGLGDTNTNMTIRSSGNVSSASMASTGNYTVNFTTDIEDANYAVVIIAPGTSGDRRLLQLTNRAVGTFTFLCKDNNFNTNRTAELHCVVVR